LVTYVTIMSTPVVADSLSSTLFGKTRRAVLALLFCHSDEAFYLRQISRGAGVGLGAVQRELKALVDAGLIVRSIRGRQIYFQANSGSPVFSEIKSLIVKTAGIGDAIRTGLAPIADRIDLALIFGSVAQGREKRASDVDILIVGNVTFAEISAALHEVQAILNREINPVVYSADELRKKIRTEDHFLKSVISGGKVFLIGDKDELERLAKGRVARRTPKQSSGNR